MSRYVIKRVLIGFVTLFVLTDVTFFLMKATPGSPFSLMKYKTPEALAAAETGYNLDKPLVEQYMVHLRGVTQRNLGESMINTGRNVSHYIETGSPVTMRLGLIVFILALVGGIALRTGAALSRHKRVSNLCIFVTTIGVSIPSFLITMIILIVFGVQLYILPFISLNSPPNYIMPALSLAFYPITMIARLARSSVLEVMNQGCIIPACSKDTPCKETVIRRALKNAILPVVTYAGPMFTFVLTGSFVIRSVFSIPGIGSAFASCITIRDYPIIMGLTIFLGFLVITFNLITDILSIIIDPRVKLD